MLITRRETSRAIDFTCLIVIMPLIPILEIDPRHLLVSIASTCQNVGRLATTSEHEKLQELTL